MGDMGRMRDMGNIGRIREKGIIPIVRGWLFGEPTADAAEKRKPDLAEVAGDKREALMGWISSDQEYYLIDDPTLEAAGTSAFSTTYELYKDMMIKWPHLRHTIKKRKNAVIGREILLNARSEDAKDVEVAEFCREMIQGISKFKDDLKEMLDSLYYGFAVSELMWGNGKNGSNGNYGGWGVEELRQRDQARFRFRLEDRALCLDMDGARSTFAPVEPNKFVVMQYDMVNENPYGQGEGRYNYWFYYFFKNSVKFWSIFTEKFSMPTAVGKYPPGSQQTEKDKLLTAIKALQSDQGITMPDNMTVELLEAQRAGTLDCYESFIRYLELSVSKNILGATLTSDEGIHGTRSQAEVHEDSKFEVTESDCASLAGIIQDQILKPVVLYNYGEGVREPQVEFDLEEDEDLLQRAQTDEILVRIGVPLGKEYFYETYGRPVPKEESVKSEGGSLKEEEGKEKEKDQRDKKDEREEDGKFKEGSLEGGDERKIAARWELDEGRFVANAVNRGKKFYFGLMKWIREAVETAEDEGQVYGLNGELAERETQALANYLTSVLFTAWGNGAGEIERMRGRDVKDERDIRGFAENIEYVFEGLTPQEAIDYLEALLPMTREELEWKLLEMRSHAFTVADIQRKDVIEKIQDRLTKALAEGRTFGDWKAGIGEMFQAEGVAPLNDFRLQTIFQTNIHRALVAGRDRMCEDLQREGILQYGKWQSVGDSRVRDSHEAMEGAVMRWDDPRWEKMKDYNCRCQKVPVFGIGKRT
jgi:SPP1 gp7 family putative phage head morphogenesis protein